MKNPIKQLFCNHTSQRCLTNIDSEYVDKLYNGDKSNKYSIWICERCGKIIKKPINEKLSTFNWINITIKDSNNP